jgi:hypothetical protein
MLNNLTVVTGDHGYGYDAYYLTRKNEFLDFPSDASIASSFGATDYEVKDVNFPIEMTVTGTLMTVSETPLGYLAKVAKHIPVVDEIVLDVGGDTGIMYVLEKIPVVGKLENFIRGTVYDGTTAIQTFTVAKGSTSIVLTDIGTPSIKVNSGAVSVVTPSGSDTEQAEILLTWSADPGANSIVVDYEYESSVVTSILSKVNPDNYADEYDQVSVYGSTTIATKYIKIMTNFKCKLTTGYTYTKSRTFYTRCKYNSTSCSSNSSAIVPAMVVCNQRLF